MISDNFVTGDNIYLRELQNFFFEVLGMMSITHYGAVGDGRVDNYGALQVAIDDAHRRGLSFLYVPYGKFIYTGELINLEGITFMGNPHAKIVNIRTSEEIPIYQFGWLGDAYYNKTEVDGKFVKKTGDIMTGNLAIGPDCEASGSLTFAQGTGCVASNLYANATNQETTASGRASHAEGYTTVASGTVSHAEGDRTTASGTQSHAEGYLTTASGQRGHAEGYSTTAGGNSAHAEGIRNIASATASHVEGRDNTASGDDAHAEGNHTTASGNQSHAQGYQSVASGQGAHAEGHNNVASGAYSHAQGSRSVASGIRSFATGMKTTASGNGSTSFGYLTQATRAEQVVMGRGNVVESGDPNYTGNLLIIGNGTINNSTLTVTDPSNALRLSLGGNLYVAGTVTPGGADYAECIEWEDGNPNEEDRTGRFAVLDGTKIRLATSQDTTSLMGVISGNPTILGDAYDDYWHGKYVTDVYGRIQYQTIDGEKVPIISPEYDRTKKYISRADRKEYGKFAMLGKLVVEDDGTCVVGEYCHPNDNGIATHYYEGFYVMERLDENHVKVFVR